MSGVHEPFQRRWEGDHSTSFMCGETTTSGRTDRYSCVTDLLGLRVELVLVHAGVIHTVLLAAGDPDLHLKPDLWVSKHHHHATTQGGLLLFEDLASLVNILALDFNAATSTHHEEKNVHAPPPALFQPKAVHTTKQKTRIVHGSQAFAAAAAKRYSSRASQDERLDRSLANT